MRIIVAGDFVPRNRVAKYIEENKGDVIFRNLVPEINDADYAIVNFECPVVNSPTEKSIDKFGPTLKCSSKAVEAIKGAGFKCLTLANNHFRDFGDIGVKDTLTACESNGLDYVGGGEDLQHSSRTLYLTIAHLKVALINACEHEFSIATVERGGSNPLNPIQQFYAIKEAREKSDFIIVIIHGGHETYQLPSPRMQETYRFFVEAGADVVINHHQHCYSGYEVYKNKPIFYGLGNFCFEALGKVKPTWFEGYMVELSINTQIAGNNSVPVDFRLIPYIQCKSNACIEKMNEMELKDFYGKIQLLNEIISDSTKLKEEHDSWMDKSTNYVLSTFSPWQNRYLKGLCARGYLPKFLGKMKRLMIINQIQCESHFDRALRALDR